VLHPEAGVFSTVQSEPGRPIPRDTGGTPNTLSRGRSTRPRVEPQVPRVETAASSLPRPRPCAGTPPELPRPQKCALRVPRGRVFSARAVTVDFDLTGGWFQSRARSSGISVAKPDFDRRKPTRSDSRRTTAFFRLAKSRKPACAHHAVPFASALRT
jgi:hypothetical protein